MEREQKGTVLSMVINTILIIAILYGGTMIKNYTLICCGYFIMCDLIEDFLAFIASSVRERRANKKHPFGFGKTENMAGIVVGCTFAFVGFYIFANSPGLEFKSPNIFATFMMLGVLLVRYANAEYQFSVGKMEQSQMLIMSAQDGLRCTLICTINCIFLLLNMINPIFDLLGALFMAILIIYEGLKIIIDNILYLNGQNDTSNYINDKVKKEVNKYTGYSFSNLDLINVRDYYLAVIEIEIDDNITIVDLLKFKLKLRWDLHKNKLNIRFVDYAFYKK